MDFEVPYSEAFSEYITQAEGFSDPGVEEPRTTISA
jgi:hypothetical protein